MHRSEKLIKDLVDAGVIKDKFCKEKAQLIIRKYLCEVHKEAVEATIVAKNKREYRDPQFYD